MGSPAEHPHILLVNVIIQIILLISVIFHPSVEGMPLNWDSYANESFCRGELTFVVVEDVEVVVQCGSREGLLLVEQLGQRDLSSEWLEAVLHRQGLRERRTQDEAQRDEHSVLQWYFLGIFEELEKGGSALSSIRSEL